MRFRMYMFLSLLKTIWFIISINFHVFDLKYWRSIRVHKIWTNVPNFFSFLSNHSLWFGKPFFFSRKDPYFEETHHASDSVWDGTKTHPSSVANILELLFCRLYVGCVVCLVCVCNKFGSGAGVLIGGGREFIRINCSCRFKFAWNFSSSS